MLLIIVTVLLFFIFHNSPLPVFNSIYNGNKVIYLTFDDGPSYGVTENVLNILKKYNVKATFFVVGNQIKGKEYILKRIYNEGHSIGLHSYTHYYKSIYPNQDAFVSEMIKTSNEVNRVLGIRPQIIRFPGGTYKHLNSKFLKKLHDMNYKVYDWNAATGDGMYPDIPAQQLFKNAVSSGGSKRYIILLMHCRANNQKTCEALPMIIKYYKNLGYQFKVLTKSDEELYCSF